MKQITVVSMLAILFASPGVAGAWSDADRAAIENAIESYVTAFNARDAQTIAELWSPEAVYVSRTSGEQVTGREAIREEFATLFAQPDAPRLKVSTESIEFISPNVALERGEATAIRPDEATSETRYQVVYVKRDGRWLVDRVTEDDVVPTTTHYDQLKDLEWLVGTWVDEGGGITIETECKWTEKQNYIYRTYKVTGEAGVESSGLQIIGWDAKKEQIRSWLFDSEGGFIEGTWNRRDDHWVVQSVATLADGGTGSFVSIFRPLGEDRYAWQKINRVVDGQILPNVDEVIVRRQ